MAGPLDIRMVLNNDRNVQFNVVDNLGNPVNITDFQIRWQVKKSYLSEALITKTVGSGITMTDPSLGQFVVQILAADTVNLAPGSYFHEAIVTDTTGKSTTLTDLGLAVGVFFLREQYAVQV